MKRFAVTVLFSLYLILLTGPLPAFAADCKIQFASPFISFGQYDSLSSTPLDLASYLKVQCPGAARNVTITLSVSPSSGGFTPRQLLFSGNLLDYNLYKDAGMTEIWGDGTGSTYTVTYLHPGGNAWVFTDLYGRIPPLQSGAILSGPGASGHTDIITGTVTWAGGSANDWTQMRAQVVASCLITGAAADMNFGAYDPTAPSDDIDGVSSFTFSCTTGSPYQLSIAVGTPAVIDGTGLRQMTDGGGNILGYRLYTDVARNVLWPSILPSSESGTTPSTAPITRGIYGRIPAYQDVPIGSYSGTSIVTITY